MCNNVEQQLGVAFHLFHLTISEGGTGSALVKHGCSTCFTCYPK